MNEIRAINTPTKLTYIFNNYMLAKCQHVMVWENVSNNVVALATTITNAKFLRLTAFADIEIIQK